VKFDVNNVEQIKLKKNYRSTQRILDFAEKSFELPGYDRENIPEQDITSLESETPVQDTTIEVCRCENEVENVLAMIQEVVNNEQFTYGENERRLGYGDIAVLTRTRSFGLDLQEKARHYGIPVAYEGGVELFKTDPAIMLLAWLRIMNRNTRRGWVVVLENAGYTLDETRHIVEEHDYPDNMAEFRQKLVETDGIGGVARKVFQRYGYADGFTDKIVEVLENTFNSTYMTRSDIIKFIEQNIEESEIYQVDNSMDENTVKIQTLHSAKGLEYPAVFISDINSGKFPSRQGSRATINYRDPVGLRQTKKYVDDEYAYSYDNWRTEILFKTLSGDYNEERRLMYVGMTRAEHHLFLTAESERASTFFTELDVEPRNVSKTPDETDSTVEDEREVLEVE
jgi:ATP-dependent exoDNAse (exonuclease V) beta subunit